MQYISESDADFTSLSSLPQPNISQSIAAWVEKVRSGWTRSRLMLWLGIVLGGRLWWWGWSFSTKHKSRSVLALDLMGSQSYTPRPESSWGVQWQRGIGLGDRWWHGHGSRCGGHRRSPRCWTPAGTGAMANAGCSWPWWQCAPQALQVEQHTWQHRQHSKIHSSTFYSPTHVPFRLAWSKRFFCPSATAAPSMLCDIDCWFSRSFNIKTYCDTVWKCVFVVLDRIFSILQYSYDSFFYFLQVLLRFFSPS